MPGGRAEGASVKQASVGVWQRGMKVSDDLEIGRASTSRSTRPSLMVAAACETRRANALRSCRAEAAAAIADAASRSRDFSRSVDANAGISERDTEH